MAQNFFNGGQSIDQEAMWEHLRQNKARAQETIAEYPAPPEIGSEGNKRLIGWFLNRLIHGVKNPEQTVANAVNILTPENEQELTDLVMGGAPMGYLAKNYRTPETINALRKAMAVENRARGPMGQVEVPNWQGATQRVLQGEEGPIYQLTSDPLDQILRGSWFHGMRPEARGQVPNRGDWAKSLPIDSPELRMGAQALPAANQFGLPASTHATPSYTRFGEPYGTSITASPSIARNFSADEYIHRVQPLYGGPPTEKIIPMWRPEGQKAMNEGYNTAFNQLLQTPQMQDPLKILAGDFGYFARPGVQMPETTASILDRFMGGLEQVKPRTGEFNTLYSKALQDQGYRGILYSPQRYGEYEMLMLDPSYVRPLDYRKVGDYTQSMNAEKFPITGPPGTPSTRKGYAAAQPEFETGATRLSDVFSQIPWLDRINEPNKRKIAELINEQYREAVMEQLFKGK